MCVIFYYLYYYFKVFINNRTNIETLKYLLLSIQNKWTVNYWLLKFRYFYV